MVTQLRAAVAVPPATGRRERIDDGDWLVHTRHLPVSRGTTWRALTARSELARWAGTYEPVRRPRGPVPAPRSVAFYFTFEGEDLLPVTYQVDEVVPRRSLRIRLLEPGRDEHQEVRLSLADGQVPQETVLVLTHAVANPALAPHVATGCEYYLDRLARVLSGLDPDVLDFDAYFVHQGPHYRGLFPPAGGRSR